MSDPIASVARGATGAAAPVEDPKLRKAARQLEGVFTQQLFKAMRETVPEDQGAVGGSSAQDMFTGLLDEHLATDPRAASTHGVGEAIYRHLLRVRGAHQAAESTNEPTNEPTGSSDGAGRHAPTVTTPAPAASLRTSP